ncbi:MAG: LamG domain-containing protein [Candidatus Hodarchaeales archaeon]|jgi:hypothetical protein
MVSFSPRIVPNGNIDRFQEINTSSMDIKTSKMEKSVVNNSKNIENKFLQNPGQIIPELTIEDGLVVYLSMDEGNGSIAFDASNNQYHGIINGSKWTTGISGSALKFNGKSDFVSVDSYLEIGNNELSVCAWVRYNSISNGWSNPIITQDRRALTLQLTTLDQKIIWYRFGEDEDVKGKQVPKINIWTFVVATNNGSHNFLYINGELQDTKIGSFDPYQSVPLIIGKSKRDDSKSIYFDGKIDEVRVYNRSLNFIEIRNLYNNPEGLTIDTDQDKIPDSFEIPLGLDPEVNDAQKDLDGDGMPNLWEYQMGLNLTKNDANEDFDHDGLTNIEEYLLGSSSRYTDTDFDRMNDLWEYQMGLNITKDDADEDKDGDWITNIWEYKGKTYPDNFWSVPLFYTEFPFLAFSLVHIIFFGIVVLSGFIGGFLGKSYKNVQIKKVIEQTGAPDYETAKKVKSGGFFDFETYKSALELNITTFEDYSLSLELKKLENQENS